MRSRGWGQLTAELVMPGTSSAAEMPRLDAFDQEFGREPVAIARGHRRKIRLKVWVLILILLGAGAISALALGWPSGDGLFPFELQSAAPLFQRGASRDDSAEQIDRLRREVETLKQEIGELNEAQRQAGETIATLKEDSRNVIPSGYWYSNMAALHFKVVSYAEPRAAVPPPAVPELRDGATSSIQPDPRVATPAPRRARREPARRGNGGNGGPISLEATPQQ
jgi:hypothetical protein